MWSRSISLSSLRRPSSSSAVGKSGLSSRIWTVTRGLLRVSSIVFFSVAVVSGLQERSTKRIRSQLIGARFAPVAAMTLEGLIWFLLIGLIAGWLAGVVM